MGRGLQQDQRRTQIRLEQQQATEGDIDVAATTPAMQALIDASTAASEAQSAESSSEHLAVASEQLQDTPAVSTKNGNSTTTDTAADTAAAAATQSDGETNPQKGDHATRALISAIMGNKLANLDPRDHARVSDPIVRPAKKNPKYRSKNGKRKSKNNTTNNNINNYNDNDNDADDDDVNDNDNDKDKDKDNDNDKDKDNNDDNHRLISAMDGNALANLDPNNHARVSDPIVRPANSDVPNNHNTGTTTTIGFSESILSRLFEPDRKQKPRLWEFIRLVAPGPASQPPKGQYKWRSKDAVAAYCLKCKIAFTYTPGTSKTVSRHLIAFHAFQIGGNTTGNNPSTIKAVAPRKSTKPKPTHKKGAVSNAKILVSVAKTPAASSSSITNSSSTKDFLSTMKRLRPFVIVPVAGNNGNESTDPMSVKTADGVNIDCDDEKSVVRDSLSLPQKKHKTTHSAPTQASNKKRRRDIEIRRRRGCPEESSEDLMKRDKEVMDLHTSDNEEDDDDDNDAFLTGRDRNRKIIIAKALFRWWVGSYQSCLDCYKNSNSHPMCSTRDATRNLFGGRNNALSTFVGFCKTLDNTFELPEPSVMYSMANTSYERFQTEIKGHVSKLLTADADKNGQSHEFVSASVRRIKVVQIMNPRMGADTVDGEDGVESKGDAEIHNDSYTGAAGECDDSLILIRGAGTGARHKNQTRGEQALGGGQHLRSEIGEKIFYPVRLTFCTPSFRIKSYVIAVIPEVREREKDHGNGNKNDETIFSPYSKAVDCALRMHGFPRDKVSRVVIRGSSQEVGEGVPSSTTSGESICILDRLDEIFAKYLRLPTILPKCIQQLLRRKGIVGEEERRESMQNLSPSIFCTVRAHEMLLASLSPSKATETVRHIFIADVLDTITPLRDAIQTLSEDLYSTIGLVIPVLRRVRDVLRHQQAKPCEEHVTAACIFEVGGDDEGGKTLNERLEAFHRLILEDFEKTFASFLNENPDLMWTVPLDPRLIAMRGLSDMERNKVKLKLVKEVTKMVQIIDRNERNQKHKIAPNGKGQSLFKTSRARYSSASTMGGIFWGDDSDPMMSNGADSNPVSFTCRNAKEYAMENVNSYFNAVHSQRHIKDPLLWWKNNQDQFPELAILARKWVSASAVYGRKNTRENESASAITTSFSDTENICRMIFLHDNNDIV